MSRNNKLSLVIIDPLLSKIPNFLGPFDYNSRIIRANCGATHWMDYSKSNKWDVEQIESLNENTKYRTAIKNRVESILKQLYNR
jgi:hypothetical protein